MYVYICVCVCILNVVADAGCRGMVASRAIAAGETILSIPHALLMSFDTAVQCSIIRGVLARAKTSDEQLCERQVVALHLLLEKHKGAGSKWSAFIKSIPDSYGTLEYWSDEEVLLLQVCGGGARGGG
jgi:hypothetical protein